MKNESTSYSHSNENERCSPFLRLSLRSERRPRPCGKLMDRAWWKRTRARQRAARAPDGTVEAKRRRRGAEGEALCWGLRMSCESGKIKNNKKKTLTDWKSNTFWWKSPPCHNKPKLHLHVTTPFVQYETSLHIAAFSCKVCCVYILCLYCIWWRETMSSPLSIVSLYVCIGNFTDQSLPFKNEENKINNKWELLLM